MIVRIAVMSDIHGFDLALETVLDDLTQRGPFDEVVVAGDLCVVGPAPKRVLEIVTERRFTVLQGNTDRDLVEYAKGQSGSAELDFALTQIGAAGIQFLASLPVEHRIVPPGGRPPHDDLLVVHANPRDLDTKLTPEMSDRQLRQVIGDARASAIAFGHHHVPFIRRLDGVLLIDVSAVGNPKDGDLRCAYAIIAWDPLAHDWTAEIMRLDYPVEESLSEMRRSGIPEPEWAIRQLLRAAYE